MLRNDLNTAKLLVIRWSEGRKGIFFRPFCPKNTACGQMCFGRKIADFAGFF